MDRAPSLPPESVSLCPGCGKPVDVLRAGHVAILDGRFRYFCDARCTEPLLSGVVSLEAETAPPPPVSARRDVQVESHTRPAPAVAPAASVPVPSFPAPKGEVAPSPAPSAERAPAPGPSEGASGEGGDGELEAVPPTLRASQPDLPVAAPAATPREVVIEEVEEPALAPVDEDAPVSLVDVRDAGVDPKRAALGVAIALGLASIAVVLAGDAAAALRLPLAALAAVVAFGVEIGRRRDPSESHWAFVVWPEALALGAAGWAAIVHDPHASRLAALVGLGAVVHAVCAVLVDRAREKSERQRKALVAALGTSARVVRGPTAQTLLPEEVKAGEQVLVEAGEVVSVDGKIAAGEAEVVPHPSARTPVTKREGDAVVAGARVVRGSLRITVTFAGADRGLYRVARSLPHRADVASQLVVITRRALERGAPLLSLCVAVAAFAQNAGLRDVLGAAAAVAMAVSSAGVLGVLVYGLGRAQLALVEKGVLYKDMAAFDAAGRVDAAVLCSRGTLLLGEPEVVAVETVGALDRDRVLSLAAGAETASSHPFATAILRTVRARSIAPEAVRSAHAHEGLGVTALSASGERIVVGSRALLLQEKISVAVADAQIEGLEGQGRSVMLVALGGKIVGIVALQDGLRVGARAAVERLAAARVEPVLLSGESRETCETIARALEIDHVRPEVLPLDRGAEVKALAEGGREVAVIGHAQSDDGALGAADVSVALGAAGSAPGEWSAATVVDDVRAGVLVVTLARRAREVGVRVVVLGLVPAAISTLGISFGVLPLVVAPVAGLIGVLAAFSASREPEAGPGGATG
ncbi:MAG: HAD family hydrolase [Myxococcales bacterium]|nr:HAD family hydrolase [Myxococcales bacterium]